MIKYLIQASDPFAKKRKVINDHKRNNLGKAVTWMKKARISDTDLIEKISKYYPSIFDLVNCLTYTFSLSKRDFA